MRRRCDQNVLRALVQSGFRLVPDRAGRRSGDLKLGSLVGVLQVDADAIESDGEVVDVDNAIVTHGNPSFVMKILPRPSARARISRCALAGRASRLVSP